MGRVRVLAQGVFVASESQQTGGRCAIAVVGQTVLDSPSMYYDHRACVRASADSEEYECRRVHANAVLRERLHGTVASATRRRHVSVFFYFYFYFFAINCTGPLPRLGQELGKCSYRTRAIS